MFSKSLKALPVLVIVILLAFTSCQNNGYPGYPFIPPTTETKLPQLATEKVASALDIAGVIEELDDSPAPDGMNVSWKVADAVQQILAVRSMSANTEETSGTPVTIIATVTFSGYSGNGLNKASGISEIKSGSIELTFKGTVSGTDTVTANLDTFTAKTTSTLTFVQERTGYVSNNYTVSAENMTGNASVEVSYTAGTTGEIPVPSVTVEGSQTVINSGSSVTVGDNTPIVDITWTGNVDTSWYTGTETPQYNLSNAEQLAGLAAIINAGTTEFAGITINLTQDIDLANRDWTPIGGVYFGEEGQNIYSDPDTNWHGFRGTFNGNNHTISNLAIGSVVYGGPEVNVKDNSYKGLFGNVESGAKIMNLNVHNATIFADAFAGVIAGYLPKSPDSNFNTVEFENINLTGLIEINGKFSLGCILGRNESGNTAIHLNNCKVTADEGSYIAMPSNITDYGMSYSYFGGLVGAVYSNSENNVIENCDVSGLAISGYLTPAGGFVGLTQTLKFNGTNRLADMVIRVSSYAEEAESYARAGAISGFVMNNEGLVNNGTFDIEDVTINYPFASGISSPACNGLVGALQDGTNPTIDFTGVDTTGINFVYIQ